MKRLELPLQTTKTDPPITGPLIDTFGRIHKKIRLSLTDKCNLRCNYCMVENTSFMPDTALLTADEVTTIVRLLHSLGINQIRLTGGEPLLRKDIINITKSIFDISKNIELSLTTNGVLLERFAKSLFVSGIRTINVSLDTLDEGQFRAITKRNNLSDVISGILYARQIGFNKIKLNAVITKTSNIDQIIPLARFAFEHNLELRFIESMPIGANTWNFNEIMSKSQIIEILTSYFGPLSLVERSDSSPAELWEIPQGKFIGIIASVTEPFCSSCDRLRLTADGHIRSCLFAHNETDIKPFLRPDFKINALESAIRSNIWNKSIGHKISTDDFIKPSRTMHAIGG